jgi:hypothetical protein
MYSTPAQNLTASLADSQYGVFGNSAALSSQSSPISTIVNSANWNDGRASVPAAFVAGSDGACAFTARLAVENTCELNDSKYIEHAWC